MGVRVFPQIHQYILCAQESTIRFWNKSIQKSN